MSSRSLLEDQPRVSWIRWVEQISRAGSPGRRGPISGVAMMAGFASTIGWPLTAWLSAEFGWRGACLTYAAAISEQITTRQRWRVQYEEAKAARAGTRVALVPVISVRPSGGLVAGLTGRF